MLETNDLVGGPIRRNGAKGLVAHLIVPHFARARVYAEPFFGAGSVFYRLKTGTYQREAINDLDSSLTTFFRVLRDDTERFIRACEFTPFSRDEFGVCIEHSDDEFEEARRVWVRARQGFAGAITTSAANWGRNPTTSHGWGPSETCSKLEQLRAYAARLRDVAIDNIDGVEFVEKWGGAETFAYLDPPYVPESRTGKTYAHEMTADDHRRLAKAVHDAVDRGGKVAISGYRSTLYDELYPSWRTVEFNVPLYGARDANGARRTEVLWCSYPASESFVGAKQQSLF